MWGNQVRLRPAVDPGGYPIAQGGIQDKLSFLRWKGRVMPALKEVLRIHSWHSISQCAEECLAVGAENGLTDKSVYATEIRASRRSGKAAHLLPRKGNFRICLSIRTAGKHLVGCVIFLIIISPSFRLEEDNVSHRTPYIHFHGKTWLNGRFHVVWIPMRKQA